MQPLDQGELAKALEKFETRLRGADGKPSGAARRAFAVDAPPGRKPAAAPAVAAPASLKRFAAPTIIAATCLGAVGYVIGVLPWPDSAETERGTRPPKTVEISRDALVPTLPAPDAETPLAPPPLCPGAPATLKTHDPAASPAPSAPESANGGGGDSALTAPERAAPPPAVAKAAPAPQKAHKPAVATQKRPARIVRPAPPPAVAARPAAAPAPMPPERSAAPAEPGYLERAQRALRVIPDTVKGFVGAE